MTLCTHNRLELFGEIENNAVTLNNAGKMIEKRLLNISYKNAVNVYKYCIMPDHIHAIIVIAHDGTTQGSFPTRSDLIKSFKTIRTKLYIDGIKNNHFRHLIKRYGKNHLTTVSYAMKQTIRKHGNTLMKILLSGISMKCMNG